ncbi:hypothetical protein TNIN_463181 [Trichonephila inaurata madagascariensis]|uniref:Uncharacterized protein n=1 Tax=Trichonephila inaurata madagascariensis TaxID=2747483 RepID=A0A8X7CCV3_9ARAC|nr:hypothetical protein TNIN_463181 [Trichonephila inaurata madagascariensis]
MFKKIRQGSLIIALFKYHIISNKIKPKSSIAMRKRSQPFFTPPSHCQNAIQLSTHVKRCAILLKHQLRLPPFERAIIFISPICPGWLFFVPTHKTLLAPTV